MADGSVPPPPQARVAASLPATTRGWLLRALRHRAVRPLLGALAIAALVIAARAYGWLEPLELPFGDMLVRMTTKPAMSPYVSLVAVTEDDIRHFGYPIPDRVLADVITHVAKAGARVIGVDFYRDIGVPPGVHALHQVMRQTPNLYWVWKLPDSNDTGVPPPPPLANTDRAVLSDMVFDPGGVLRRGLLLAENPKTGGNVRTLGTALAERWLHESLRADGSDALSLGGHRLALVEPPWGPFVTEDGSGYQILLDWHGGQMPFPVISFWQALHDPNLAAKVHGRAIVVGVAALSVKDIFPTPFTTGANGRPMPGLASHAHIADQLIRTALGLAKTRAPLPRWADDGLIVAWAIGGAFLTLLTGGIVGGAIGIAGGVALAFAGGYFGLGQGLILPVIPVGLAWVGAAGSSIFLLHGSGMRDRARLQKTFEHYLDPRIITEIVKSGELPGFGGERREITAIFTDVAGFTTFSEQMDAKDVADLLNAYFDRMAEIVMQHGGLVNDFIGDALIALFGVPQRQDDHPDRAVATALALDAVGQTFRAECLARGIAFGATRVGVHTGIALVGNMGTRSRLKYTALGDMMNTASRVEGINKYFGTRICVTGETASRCRDHRFREVADVVVKGRQAALQILSPLPPDRPDDSAYAEAIAALRAGSADAGARFAALAESRPDDPLVIFHAKRLAEGETGATIVMTEK